jgi:pyruvoyl-dependent arginine decarboxylase (PvlArgDC)
MKMMLAFAIVFLFLTGCASTGAQQKVERITPEQLAKILPPPVATVTLEEIVVDSKAGKTADEIIAKIKTSNSRYELTTAQTLDLSKQGVDVKVLDYIHKSNEAAKQNAIADEMNKREQEKRAAQKQLQRERALAQSYYYDYFDGPFYNPYYHYGYGPYYGSRFFWGPSFYYRHNRR